MGAQDLILGARVAHLRELKSEVARLKAECAALRDENAALNAHMSLAALAARDLAALPPDGRLVIVDGWNLILGARKEAKDPADLLAQAKRRVAERPSDRVWIVFDGPRESSRVDGGVRISYTGGKGPHRADRLVCDYLRMARLSGDVSRIEVVTNDRDFRRDADRLLSGS
jgi:hypothetical protein